jgi:hypothetical protein
MSELYNATLPVRRIAHRVADGPRFSRPLLVLLAGSVMAAAISVRLHLALLEADDVMRWTEPSGYYLPRYPGAQELDVRDASPHFYTSRYVAQAGREDVFGYYKNALVSKGWVVNEAQAFSPDELVLSWRHTLPNYYDLTLSATEEGGQTTVIAEMRLLPWNPANYTPPSDQECLHPVCRWRNITLATAVTSSTVALASAVLLFTTGRRHSQGRKDSYALRG